MSSFLECRSGPGPHLSFRIDILSFDKASRVAMIDRSLRISTSVRGGSRKNPRGAFCGFDLDGLFEAADVDDCLPRAGVDLGRGIAEEVIGRDEDLEEEETGREEGGWTKVVEGKGVTARQL